MIDADALWCKHSRPGHPLVSTRRSRQRAALACFGPEVDTRVACEAVDLGVLLGGELEMVEGGHVLLELRDPTGGDDEARHALVAERPGERQLCERLPATRRDRVKPADAFQRLVRQHRAI